MGKIEAFDITFDQSKEVYIPGETISGTVTIKVGQKIPCKAVKVNCNGFCGLTNKVNDTAWTVEEQYFNNTISVADKGAAPTSFEGNYGRIGYRVRAFIDTPRFTKDYNTEKAFYLLDPLNLNKIPDIWGPCSSSVTQEFTYMLLKTGTVFLKAQTDMKGYTPGQIIHLSATVHNRSDKSTGNISASLMQRVTYETKRPIHDERSIAEVEGGRVKAGREKEWKEQIIVPPLPQSSLVGCDLIKINYYVKVSLKSPAVMLTLPLHIGNVSLDKNFSSAPLTTPALPPRPAPRPAPRAAPRSKLNSPTAPPDEPHQRAEGGTPMNGSFMDQHSQLVSPGRFSYTLGLSFSDSRHNQPGTNPQILIPSSATSTLLPSMNSASPHIMPPDYGSSEYPQEAPPSYDESMNT
ncbi:arrestin domain-containing protein 1a isoform X2 [Dunckerocampus dactyliophorus]|uniref:arrestin domain-containing protein 1a isoform X2 n=1 Tax=Dunckerocampus dactyliophorus TaxID=161453 RepID=UPI002406A5B0|nr:arrestin domain-containing protein 1a isoform X2 [Dunckerocampus dactyliophorus]